MATLTRVSIAMMIVFGVFGVSTFLQRCASERAPLQFNQFACYAPDYIYAETTNVWTDCSYDTFRCLDNQFCGIYCYDPASCINNTMICSSVQDCEIYCGGCPNVNIKGNNAPSARVECRECEGATITDINGDVQMWNQRPATNTRLSNIKGTIEIGSHYAWQYTTITDAKKVEARWGGRLYMSTLTRVETIEAWYPIFLDSSTINGIRKLTATGHPPLRYTNIITNVLDFADGNGNVFEAVFGPWPNVGSPFDLECSANNECRITCHQNGCDSMTLNCDNNGALCLVFCDAQANENCPNVTGSWVQMPSPQPTTSPTPAPTPPLYSGVGAYCDTHDRNLRFGPHAYGYNADTCYTACFNLGYKYFALQDGSWCSCDNDFNHVTRNGAPGQPGSNCIFDSVCGPNGGTWCNYVYEVNTNTESCNWGLVNVIPLSGTVWTANKCNTFGINHAAVECEYDAVTGAASAFLRYYSTSDCSLGAGASGTKLWETQLAAGTFSCSSSDANNCSPMRLKYSSYNSYSSTCNVNFATGYDVDVYLSQEVSCLNANMFGFQSISYSFGYTYQSVTFHSNANCVSSVSDFETRNDDGCHYHTGLFASLDNDAMLMGYDP